MSPICTQTCCMVMHWVRTKPYTDSVGGYAGPARAGGGRVSSRFVFVSLTLPLSGLWLGLLKLKNYSSPLSEARVFEYDSGKGAAHKPKSAQVTNSRFQQDL